MMNKILPPISWHGGKRRISKEIIKKLKYTDEIYVEPFLGMGSIFLELKPQRAIINDLNPGVINLFKTIKNNVKELIEITQYHEKNKSKEYYYKLRNIDRTEEYNKLTDVEKSARIIFLTKNSFSQMYRINSKGQFNTSYGGEFINRKLNVDNLIEISKYLNSIDLQIYNEDFYNVVNRILKTNNKFIFYFDPPYYSDDSEIFTYYTTNKFNLEKQKELKYLCDKINDKNLKFVLSNNDCNTIRELYSEYYINKINIFRSLNNKSEKKKKVNELIINN